MNEKLEVTENEALRKTAVSSQPKFTQGEWYLQTNADAYTNIIRCNKGKGFETYYIASTPKVTSEEVQANAQLIAASPDLLKVLIDFVSAIDSEEIIIKENYDNDGFENCAGRLYSSAKKAIEKALTIQKKGF